MASGGAFIDNGECKEFFSSDSCEQYSDKLERYRIFFLSFSILGLIGCVKGIVECIPGVRKFMIHHTFIVEDENEHREHEEMEDDEIGLEMENIERNELSDMVERTASNHESVIESRMVNDGNNDTFTVHVHIHADEEALGQGDNTTDAHNQAGREGTGEQESDNIPPEQVTLLVK